MMEVTEQSKEEIKYPVARRNRNNGQVILFFSKQNGVVVKSSAYSRPKLGDYLSGCTPCSDYKMWEPIDITITG